MGWDFADISTGPLHSALYVPEALLAVLLTQQERNISQPFLSFKQTEISIIYCRQVYSFAAMNIPGSYSEKHIPFLVPKRPLSGQISYACKKIFIFLYGSAAYKNE